MQCKSQEAKKWCWQLEPGKTNEVLLLVSYRYKPTKEMTSLFLVAPSFFRPFTRMEIDDQSKWLSRGKVNPNKESSCQKLPKRSRRTKDFNEERRECTSAKKEESVRSRHQKPRPVARFLGACVFSAEINTILTDFIKTNISLAERK